MNNSMLQLKAELTQVLTCACRRRARSHAELSFRRPITVGDVEVVLCFLCEGEKPSIYIDTIITENFTSTPGKRHNPDVGFTSRSWFGAAGYTGTTTVLCHDPRRFDLWKKHLHKSR